MPPFKLDADLLADRRPAGGDRRHRRGASSAGARGVTLLGATGTGKTMTMAATIEAAAAAGARHRAQQDARRAALQRVPDVLPEQLGRVLRLLLRLLPARGVRPVARPLHREGLGDQPGDRPAAPRGDGVAVRAPRRDHRRLGVRASSASARRRPTTRTARCSSRAAAWTATSSCASSSRLQYNRNDTALGRGTFRVRGDTLEVFPAYEETAFRAMLFGDEVERLQHFDPLTGELIRDDLEHVAIWPATHYNVKEGTLERRGGRDRPRAQRALRRARGRGQAARVAPPAPAHAVRHGDAARGRLLLRASRTTRASSTARTPGSRPYCLIDYFPKDFVCFIDESHQTVPQIGGMYEGDRSRKQTLVDYGFRLPSALDNRPQTFDEFLTITPQLVFVSATPGQYERDALGARRRADRAPDRDRRPRGRGARDAATRSTT